ncbi:hypothetical protein M378DRAFT_172406 [Amanita muscaria Koide BX008]|uniref:Uncharacterized protein n=1 Tax=Amanita muscaria (strain Koide BX008) TaxID=946122 RepID=A0A0C2SRW5_AMAMK|nr:hypothetical protein M378DRAFT_172406 [Amanita muscaria Koide BX008]
MSSCSAFVFVPTIYAKGNLTTTTSARTPRWKLTSIFSVSSSMPFSSSSIITEFVLRSQKSPTMYGN